MTSHDMARGEAQRDFADAIGVNSRALVEGLFGVQAGRARGRTENRPRLSRELGSREHPPSRFQF